MPVSTSPQPRRNLAGLCEEVGRGADALRRYHAYKKLTEG